MKSKIIAFFIFHGFLRAMSTVSIVDSQTHSQEEFCVLWQEMLSFKNISQQLSEGSSRSRIIDAIQPLYSSIKDATETLGSCEQNAVSKLWRRFFPKDETKIRRRFLKAKEAYWQCLLTGDVEKCLAQEAEHTAAHTDWIRSQTNEKAETSDLLTELCKTGVQIQDWVKAYESGETDEIVWSEISSILGPLEYELAQLTAYSGHVRLTVDYADFNKLPIYQIAIAWNNHALSPWSLIDTEFTGKFILFLQDVCLKSGKIKSLDDSLCTGWQAHLGSLENENEEIVKRNPVIEFTCKK